VKKKKKEIMAEPAATTPTEVPLTPMAGHVRSESDRQQPRNAGFDFNFHGIEKKKKKVV